MLFKKSNNLKEKINKQNDKGDGKPYLEWLEETYANMTDEEKSEVEEIGKFLETKFCFSDQDNDNEK